MGNLKIKTESLPERCEICHQSDCFDPVTNRCTRCQNVATPVNKPYQPRPRHRRNNNRPAVVTSPAPERWAQNLFMARFTLLGFTYFGFILQFARHFYQACQRWIKYAIREDETLTKKHRSKQTQPVPAQNAANASPNAPVNEKRPLNRNFIFPHARQHHRQTRANTRNHRYRR